MSAIFNIDKQDEDFCVVQRAFSCFEVGHVLFNDERYEAFINGPESATPLLFNCCSIGSERMRIGLGVVRDVDTDQLDYGGLWELSTKPSEGQLLCIAFTANGTIDAANTTPSSIDYLCTEVLHLDLKYRDVVVLCAQHYYSMMIYRVYLAADAAMAAPYTDDLDAIARVNTWRKIDIVLRASAGFLVGAN